MSSPYMFGVSRHHFHPGERARIAKIANVFGCDFISAQRQNWFATRRPQLGEPFDSGTARAVFQAMEDAGIDLDVGWPKT